MWAYRILGALLLLAAAFGAGWYFRTPEIRTETKIETVVKTEQVQVDHIVVRTVKVKETKPDGAVTETETTEKTDNTTTKTNTTDKAKDVAVTPAPKPVVAYQPNYSLGVQWRPDFRDPTWVPAQATVGYRALGNAWVEGGYDIKDRAAVIGVRVEF